MDGGKPREAGRDELAVARLGARLAPTWNKFALLAEVFRPAVYFFIFSKGRRVKKPSRNLRKGPPTLRNLGGMFLRVLRGFYSIRRFEKLRDIQVT